MVKSLKNRKILVKSNDFPHVSHAVTCLYMNACPDKVFSSGPIHVLFFYFEFQTKNKIPTYNSILYGYGIRVTCIKNCQLL